MLRVRHLLPLAFLLGACSEPATAPDGSEHAPVSLATREPFIRCTASGTAISGYTMLIEWKQIPVLKVSILTDDDRTTTTTLNRPRKNGSVGFAPSAQPIGFRVEDGQQVLAQGGCTPA